MGVVSNIGLEGDEATASLSRPTNDSDEAFRPVEMYVRFSEKELFCFNLLCVSGDLWGVWMRLLCVVPQLGACV